MKRNPNRGVVLRLDDAAVLHRMMEFFLDTRKFDNPIVAMEIKSAAREATQRLGEKLIAIYEAHRERTNAPPQET